MRILQTGRFRYLEAPSPPGGVERGTLVLVHAFPLNARMWEPQADLAGRGWRLIAPQLRGFDGGGEPPAASMDDYAADVVGLLDALGIERAVIGGLSLGGYVTFAIFRRDPARFRAMVLADTRAEADTPEGIEGRKKMLALVEAQGPAAVADAMLPKLVAEETRRSQPGVVETVRGLMLASGIPAITGALTAMMGRPDSTPQLAAITCPTLILVGEHDQLTPPALSRDMHRAVPHSELATIAGAGHLASLEQPAAFNRVLGGFLDRLEGRAGG